MRELLLQTLSSDDLTSSIVNLRGPDTGLDDGVGCSLSFVNEVPDRAEWRKRKRREGQFEVRGGWI